MGSKPHGVRPPTEVWPLIGKLSAHNEHLLLVVIRCCILPLNTTFANKPWVDGSTSQDKQKRVEHGNVPNFIST